MEKNKLGIVINTTKANNRTSGFRSIYRFNDDEWSSVIRDTGAELKKVTNNSTSAPIHFIQFESNGCCYCIMQSIAGRKDYQSAWIFIHKDILLPNGELSSIIQKVEEFLSLDVEDKKAELDKLFGKPYPTTNNPSYPVSSGDTYAVRYYGKGTNFMYERNSVLDDEYRYQSEYCKYKSVFLIDKESGLQVSDVQDLSNTKLEKNFVIELPAELYGFKHNLVANSLRVTEGAQVRVRWTRSGYAPVDKQGKCSEDLLIQKSDCYRSFRLDLFRVVDKVTGHVLNEKPEFTGIHRINDSRNPTIVYFREEDLDKVSCCIEIATYERFVGTLDLTKPNAKGEYVIELLPEQHVYKCYIETNIPDVRTIEFEINTQHRLRGTEIPGFQFDGNPSEQRRNKLKANSQQRVKDPKRNQPQEPIGNQMSIGNGFCEPEPPRKKHAPWYLYAIVVILLLSILGGIYYFFIRDEEVSDPQNAEVVDSQSKSDWETAFDYLKGQNTFWIKDDMESYLELKGVYTMIKDYQFKKLKSFIERHKEDLMQIDSWNRLYYKIQNCNDKKGAFKAIDGKINMEEYFQTDFKSMNDVTNNSETQNDDRISNNSNAGTINNGGSNRNTNNNGGSNGNSGSNGNGGSNTENNQDNNT